MVAQPGQQSSPLFRSPPEILMRIFQQAGLADSVCLALSCKRLLQTSTLCKLQIPARPPHQPAWCGAKTLEDDICTCDCLEELLKRLPPKDRQGRPSRAWNLCVDCLQYRPTRKSYWSLDAEMTKMAAEEQWDRSEDVIRHVFLTAVKWFSDKVKIQCPSCHIAECRFKARMGLGRFVET